MVDDVGKFPRPEIVSIYSRRHERRQLKCRGGHSKTFSQQMSCGLELQGALSLCGRTWWGFVGSSNLNLERINDKQYQYQEVVVGNQQQEQEEGVVDDKAQQQQDEMVKDQQHQYKKDVLDQQH